MTNNKNFMQLNIKAISANDSLARSAVAAFCAQLDPTVDQISDIKTVVSEAVTNAIVHGYNNSGNGIVYIKVQLNNNVILISVADKGVGIKDVSEALKPFYTTKPNAERSGMGFTVMESYCDKLKVKSSSKGTIVQMKIIIKDETTNKSVQV